MYRTATEESWGKQPAEAAGVRQAGFGAPADSHGPPPPSDTRWITRTVALLSTVVFVVSGSQLLPDLFSHGAVSYVRDSGHATAFLLNIALLLFAWRRSVQLKKTFGERDEAQRRAYNLAHYDEVTGLLNRRRLRELLAEMCARKISKSALILIDLDDFKKINDLYGHALGDQVLHRTAQRLAAACPQEGHCVRLGGDEFAILLQGASARKGSAVELAESLVAELNKTMRAGKTVTTVGVSIGVALLNKPCKDPDWLLQRADIAMYEAKRLGRNQCVCFDIKMEEALERRSALEAELRDGIETGEFLPFFQPIIDLATGRIRGFEVLARWQHPDKGLLEPAEFLGLAEAAGVISDLSFHVMQEALGIARDWPSEYKIAVNISPMQFNDPLLAARVVKVLRATGFPPGRLELEIMEKSLLQDHVTALATISSLKKQGIAISVDDLGMGYATLTQLAALPFDRMKIDRAFMASLLDDNQCDALVRAVAGLGKGLKIPVTAEGVETEALRAKLEELGCADAQGWLFSKPLSAEEAARVLSGSADGAASGRRSAA